MIEASRMAVLVNQKLCHDFAEPMNAIVTGLDLIKGTPLAEKNPEAVSLLEQGADKAMAKLMFFRFILEDSTGEDMPLDEMREMITKLYAQLRPDLVWSAPAMTMPKAALRVVASLLLFAADSAPRGSVEISGADGEIHIVSSSPRAKLKPQTAAALRGEPEGGEYDSRSILPGLVGHFARKAGVEIVTRESEDQVEIIARSPQFRMLSAAA